MASKVEICNLALLRVGETQRISSLTENTEPAKLCNLLYDTIADEVMAEGPWTRAINRVALAQTTNTPAFGYSYEFQLPTTPVCLKVLSINDTVPGQLDYVIEGDKLLADDSAVKIKYIGRITNTGEYGPYLTRAIVSRLAAELAYPLTGNAGVAERLLERYRADLFEALAVDNQQGKPDAYSSESLIEIR